MAVYNFTRPAPFGAITGYRVGRFVDGIVSGLRRWSVARQTEAELRKLSDRELDDIGLSRGWIEDFSSDFAVRR